MPLTSALAFKLGCALLGIIFGIFEIESGVSLYQAVVKPASRFPSPVVVPDMPKLKQFLAGDNVSESPMFAPTTLNTVPDVSQNDTGTTNETALAFPDVSHNDADITNETALAFPEMAFQISAIALVDWLDDVTTDEKMSCPFVESEPLVVEPNVASPFRVFIEILKELMIFLLYYVLNAELRIFDVWEQQLCLFAPTWVWERELKARMTRCLDLLLALAPVLSLSKHVAIVDELEKRLTTEHERTVQGILDEHRLVNEAKDAEIEDLRQQLRNKDAVEAWQISAIYTAMETESQDETRDHAMQVGENDGLLGEHLKTIEEYQGKFTEMLKETSDKSKRIFDLEASMKRMETQMKTYDEHLTTDGWKMTPMGLRPLAPPAPPFSRIPTPQFRSNGPPFNPGAAQFVPRPAPFAPQPPHYQPGFRGPQADPRFMGH